MGGLRGWETGVWYAGGLGGQTIWGAVVRAGSAAIAQKQRLTPLFAYSITLASLR